MVFSAELASMFASRVVLKRFVVGAADLVMGFESGAMSASGFSYNESDAESEMRSSLIGSLVVVILTPVLLRL